MKKSLSIFLFVLWINNVNSQRSYLEIVSSAGEIYKTNSMQIDWTIGELAITTMQNTTQQITQGFHQANYIITNVNDLPKEIGHIQVYPNPTSDRIEMELNFDKTRNVKIHLIDPTGRLIWVKQENGIKIKKVENIANLSDGTYFLNFLIDNRQYLQTYKIQKLN